MTRASVAAAFDSSAIGEWGEEEVLEVTAERLAAYAESTNDPIPAHLAGTVAPPLFAVVPIMPTLFEAAFVVAPPEVAVRVLHGKQDIRFHRPIHPDDVIRTRTKPIGYKGQDNGTAAAFLIECRDAAGELVNEQYMTMFFPRFDAGETVGELAPEHRFDEALRSSEPVATVTAHMDDDQTFRYSPAAGDPMPVHLDEDTAKAAGLPGIIIHGLCTQAYTSWAALTQLADGNTERLKRLAVRFAKPVLPGQDVRTTFWKANSDNGITGITTYLFEVTVDGVVVIQDGLAEIAD